MLSVGKVVQYITPTFEILGVSLRKLKVKGYSNELKEEVTLDFFIRNDPAWILMKDFTVVEVSASVQSLVIIHCACIIALMIFAFFP